MSFSSFLELDQVSKQFSGNEQISLQPISLTIEAGQFVTILGTSGSGKTTLLKLLNRLIEPSTGEIRLQGQSTKTIPAPMLRRQMGYVIQQAGLFPHMTIAQNISAVPQILGWSTSRTAARVEELLNLVELPPEEFKDRYPAQLSGGQQQRVGLARALAGDPPILLMDEPFGAIDAITRLNLQGELLRIQQKLRKTIVFVTHDIAEALKLGDKVLAMHAGQMQQFDTPDRLLSHPANDFVRTLLQTDESQISAASAALFPQRSPSAETARAVLPEFPRLPETASLKEALAMAQDGECPEIAVEDLSREVIGIISVEAHQRKCCCSVGAPDDVGV